MSQKFHQTKEFKNIDTIWKKKLKASGFQDQEIDEYLQKDSEYYRRNYSNTIKVEAKETYYRLAGQFLYSHKFTTQKEELIWKLHAEGLSDRDIADRLKKLGFTSTKKSAVNNITKSLGVLMIKESNSNEQE